MLLHYAEAGRLPIPCSIKVPSVPVTALSACFRLSLYSPVIALANFIRQASGHGEGEKSQNPVLKTFKVAPNSFHN